MHHHTLLALSVFLHAFMLLDTLNPCYLHVAPLSSRILARCNAALRYRRAFCSTSDYLYAGPNRRTLHPCNVDTLSRCTSSHQPPPYPVLGLHQSSWTSALHWTTLLSHTRTSSRLHHHARYDIDNLFIGRILPCPPPRLAPPHRVLHLTFLHLLLPCSLFPTPPHLSLPHQIPLAAFPYHINSRRLPLSPRFAQVS